MTDLPDPALPGRDVSLSMERANLLAGALFPLLAGAVLLPFWAVWGWDALAAGFADAFLGWVWMPVFVALIVLHEALHGLGFLLFGHAPRHALHFGMDRKTLTPFAGCRVSVSAAGYRGAVLLPCLLLGVLPGAVALANGVGWLAVLGAAMTAAAGGDLLVVWAIRRLPGTARVLDHPSRVGCVLPDEAREGAGAEVGTGSGAVAGG